jgi:hypothetical protein
MNIDTFSFIIIRGYVIMRIRIRVRPDRLSSGRGGSKYERLVDDCAIRA